MIVRFFQEKISRINLYIIDKLPHVNGYKYILK